MRRFSVLAAVAVFALVAFEERAEAQQYVTTEVTFATVDSVYVYSSRMQVRGIVSGEAASTEYRVDFYSGAGEGPDQAANCARLAVLAMEKPGAYLFNVKRENSSYYSCRLTRVNL